MISRIHSYSVPQPVVRRAAQVELDQPLPVDSLEACAQPDPESPVSAGQVAAGLVGGPAGPVLASELEALEANFLLERRFRLPFMARHRTISPERAAKMLNRGRAERLSVDLGTGPLPLPDTRHFRELQHLEEQPGPALVNPATGGPAHPYEAFLNAPVVLVEDDLPAVLEQLTTAGAVPPALVHFQAEDPLLVRSSRRMAEAGLEPKEIAGRIRLLEDSPNLEQELQTVEPFQDPETFRAASHAFRGMLKTGASPKEARAVLHHVKEPDHLNKPDALAAELEESWEQASHIFNDMQVRGTPAWRAFGNLAPVAAALKDAKYGSYLKPIARLYEERLSAVEEPCAHHFLADVTEAGLRGREAVRAVEQVLAPAGTLTLEERADAYRQLVLGSEVFNQSASREAAFEAFRAEVEAGATSHEALTRLGELGQVLTETKTTYRSYVAPLLTAWARHLAGGQEASRRFLEELVQHGVKGREGAQALEQLSRPGPLSTQDRMQAYRALVFSDRVVNQDHVRGQAFEAFLAEVEAGTGSAEAVQRLHHQARALERNKSTWYGYAAQAFAAYRENAVGGSERAPARAFLEELTDAGIRRREVVQALRQVSEPLAGLSLEERIAAYRELLLSRKTTMNQDNVRAFAFEAFRAEVEKGTPPELARPRLDRLATALEENKSTWYGSMAPAFQAYAEHLAGGEELEPARAFTEELLAGGIRRGELRQALKQALQSPDGMELYRRLLTSRETPLNQDGVRAYAFKALCAELESGTSADTAVERLDRLAEAHTAHKSTWYGYMAFSLLAYAEHLAGGPELDSARAFLTRLDEAGVRRAAVRRAIEQVAQPLRNLSLDERIQLYEKSALAGGLDRVRGQAFDIVRAEVVAGAEPEEAASRLRTLGEALERNRVGYHQERVLAVYNSHFSSDPDAGVTVLVELLDAKLPAARAAAAAAEVGALLEKDPAAARERLEALKAAD